MRGRAAQKFRATVHVVRVVLFDFCFHARKRVLLLSFEKRERERRESLQKCFSIDAKVDPREEEKENVEIFGSQSRRKSRDERRQRTDDEKCNKNSSKERVSSFLSYLARTPAPDDFQKRLLVILGQVRFRALQPHVATGPIPIGGRRECPPRSCGGDCAGRSRRVRRCRRSGLGSKKAHSKHQRHPLVVVVVVVVASWGRMVMMSSLFRVREESSEKTRKCLARIGDEKPTTRNDDDRARGSVQIGIWRIWKKQTTQITHTHTHAEEKRDDRAWLLSILLLGDDDEVFAFVSFVSGSRCCCCSRWWLPSS